MENIEENTKTQIENNRNTWNKVTARRKPWHLKRHATIARRALPGKWSKMGKK